MVNAVTAGLLLIVCAVIATVAGTTVEIFDGNYYGIEDDNGVTSISVSGQATNTSVLNAGHDLVISPLPANDDQVQSAGRFEHHRREHHHRGRHHHRGHHGHRGHRGHHGHHGHHGYGELGGTGFTHMTSNWTNEQKLEHICNRLQLDRRQGIRRGRRESIMHRKLQMMNEYNRLQVIELWNRRKQDMLGCCSLGSNDERIQCVNRVRLARYDRVCRGEEPLCIWAAYMPQDEHHGLHHRNSNSAYSTTNTTATCCPLQDDERLQCFETAKNIYRQRYLQMAGNIMDTSAVDRRRQRPDERGNGRQNRRRFHRPDAPIDDE